MLSDFGAMIEFSLSLLKFEMTIGEYTFSFWQIFLFGIVASIVVWALWEVFLGD